MLQILDAFTDYTLHCCKRAQISNINWQTEQTNVLEAGEDGGQGCR